MVDRQFNKRIDLLEVNATDEARRTLPDTINEIRSISSDIAKTIRSHGWKMAILTAAIIVIAYCTINEIIP